MAEPVAPPPREELPQAVPRKAGPRSLSLVWIIPILALAIGAGLVVKSLWERGPRVTIRFQTAEGLEANKTRIKYKDVDIGVVKDISLSDDRNTVLVEAELVRRGSSAFLAEDTRFWVVRPRIAGGQVSGLGTLLAGAHIGADPGKAQAQKREFVGLETPPIVTTGLPGRQFKLRAEELGSIDVGSPVYFRGLIAGRVVATEVTPDGKSVVVTLFVNQPFDRFVNGASRFWNASGVDLNVDASGVRVQSESLITLLIGGIAFETPVESAGLPTSDASAIFVLWKSREEAAKPRETVIETYLMTFAQSVRGLAVGAPVDFRGLVVGEVTRIDLQFDPKAVNFRTAVEVRLFPERLRSRFRDPNRASTLPAEERIARFVEHGFRGQLRSANLLTGQLYVAVDFFPQAPRARIDASRTPPEIPTVAGGLSELQESVGNIVKKLEKIPFDAIANDLRRALQSADATLRKADTLMATLNDQVAPELRGTLEQARKTFTNAEKVLAADSPLQSDLRETLLEVTRAAESLRALVDYLERHPESLIRGRRPVETKK